MALLWFFDRQTSNYEASAAQLGKLIHDLSLRGQVNATRLGRRLGAHKDVVRGTKVGTFKLKLGSKLHLTSKLEPLLKRPVPKVESHLIPSEDFIATRRYLETLVFQINGTYQFGFYDGCAVLARRLVETLLIEAFEQAGKGSVIKKDNSYLQLSEIIALAQSGQYVRLARTSAGALTEIKDLGDTAAHNRTYTTKQKDIDDLKLKLRRIVSELQHLAKIEPSKEG